MSKCEICNREFKTRHALSIHIAKAHEMPFRNYNEFILKNRPLCACGCGGLVEWRQARWNKYLPCHNMRDKDRTGDKNPNWKGGRYTANGYWWIQAPDHPKADSHGYYAEHIILAEKIIMRPLTDGECVHHVDGDTRNNSPDNLQVMTLAEHSAHHIRDLRIWEKCIISKDDLEQALHLLRDGLGRNPTKMEMRKIGPYSENPYIRVWGSWSNALKEVLGDS